MQKLQAKLKNVPKDAHQVLCSTNLLLNKEETLSATDIVLTCNNPEGDQSGSNQKQNTSVSVKVYVLNMRGGPLMPCSPRKAKKLLKEGAAKVLKRFPFTIQLTRATGESRQAITLGVDTGYKNIGISAVSEKEELLSANVLLRTDISDKLKEKKMYRVGRRNKLWYREPRWSNRANARKEGRLMPSVLQKVNTHINLIEKIKKMLPISNIIIETGLFDVAKMENDGIRNWQYAKGEMFGFENVKAYVLSRDSHKCQCDLSGCSEKLQVHHIKFRSRGGSDNPNNLITLCEKHHTSLHEGKIKLNVKKHKELKSATTMNVIRKRILDHFPEAIETFGYETKVKMREIQLDKSHINDAFVIANGKGHSRVKPFNVIQKRKNNRCLQLNRKGFKPSIKKERSKIQPLDLFWITNKKYTCKGMFSYGKYICYGSTKLKAYFKIELVESYFNQGSLVWE